VAGDETLIAFTGSVHHVNAGEARTLYRAVAMANDRGIPCRLLRTGMNHCRFLGRRDQNALRHVIDLGFLSYDEIARHLSACDLLVQPGRPGPFNDYRLPSKIPEYLAVGVPVALPATNIGLLLRDRQEAMLLHRGDEEELVAVIAELRGDRDLAARLGEAGRAFAEARFHKDAIVRDLEVFYDGLRKEGRQP
jgi:glycosyltransferase involved in cell wall biosynthesis